jgi:hypothetical protein
VWVSARPGFRLQELWLLSVFSTVVQAVLCALFVRRELRLRLEPPGAMVAPQETAA